MAGWNILWLFILCTTGRSEVAGTRQSGKNGFIFQSKNTVKADCTPILTITPVYAKIGDTISISCGVADTCTDYIYFTFNTNPSAIALACQIQEGFIDPDDIISCSCSSTAEEPQYDCYNLAVPVEGLQVYSNLTISKQEYFGTWVCRTAPGDGNSHTQELKTYVSASIPQLTMPSLFIINEVTQIQCEASSGIPAADIWWFVEFGEFEISNQTSNSTSYIVNGTVYSTLEYVPVKEHNTGTVYCEAVQIIDSSSSSISSEKHTLNITYGPEVDIGPCPDLHIAEEGNNTQLVCAVIDANPGVFAFNWLHQGNLLVESSSTLLIPNVSPFDAGYYSCSGINGVIPGTKNDSLIVEIQHGPRISSPINGENITAIENDNLEVECIVSYIPNGTVGWIRDGYFREGSFLKFEPVKKGDAGYYTCNACNKITPCGSGAQQRETSATIYLDVLYQPYGTPSIQFDKNVIAVHESHTMKCKSDNVNKGNPEESFYIWRNDDVEMRNFSSDQWTFSSKNVLDSGYYTCAIGNCIGESNRSDSIHITVEACGTIELHTSSSKNPVISPNDHQTELLFSCLISSSNSPSNQHWTYTNSLLSADFEYLKPVVIDGVYSYNTSSATNYTMEWNVPEKQFTCCNVTIYDGEYICQAEVEVAGQNKNVASDKLTISTHYAALWNASRTWIAAELGEENVVIDCLVCANPLPTQYVWLYEEAVLESCGDSSSCIIPKVNYSDFGQYTCRVTNAVAVVDHLIFLNESSPAGAPVDFAVWPNITSTSISLTWKEGRHGGWPPLTYHISISNVNCQDDDSYTFEAHIDGPENGEEGRSYTHVVESLNPQLSYHFRILSSNERIDGQRRSESTDICDTWTEASPIVILDSAVIKNENLMRVDWTYVTQLYYNAYIEPYVVTVRVSYSLGSDTDEEVYPLHNETAINATEKGVDVPGRFDTSSTYSVYLKIYENWNVQESYKTEPYAVTLPETGLSGGGIAGIVIGALLLIALVVFAVFGYIYRDRIFKKEDYQDEVRLGEMSGDPRVEFDNPMYPSHENGGGPVYAQVDKSKKAANKVTTEEDTKTYVNVNFQSPLVRPPIAPKPQATPIKPKPNLHELPTTRMMDADGCIYMRIDGLEFPQNKSPQKRGKPVIHGIENLTVYATIDFKARAPTPPPEYEEEEDVMGHLPDRPLPDENNDE